MTTIGGGTEATEPAEVPAPAPVRRTDRRIPLAVGVAVVVLAAGLTVAKVGTDAVVAVFHGLVELVTEPAPTPRHVVAPAPPEQAAAPARDALADLSPEARAALIGAPPTGDFTFRFQPGRTPGEICRAMDAAGLANRGWARASDAGFFECMSDLMTVPGSKPVARTVEVDPEAGGTVELPPQASTLFFVARGRGAEAIDTVRFKLNLDDPSVDAAGRRLLGERIADLGAALSWQPPEAMLAAIRNHRKYAAEIRGIHVDVHPEGDPVKRVNVVLVLGRPANRLPPDRFVALPPMPEELAPPPEPRRPAPVQPATP